MEYQQAYSASDILLMLQKEMRYVGFSQLHSVLILARTIIGFFFLFALSSDDDINNSG